MALTTEILDILQGILSSVEILIIREEGSIEDRVTLQGMQIELHMIHQTLIHNLPNNSRWESDVIGQLKMALDAVEYTVKNMQSYRPIEHMTSIAHALALITQARALSKRMTSDHVVIEGDTVGLEIGELAGGMVFVPHDSEKVEGHVTGAKLDELGGGQSEPRYVNTIFTEADGKVAIPANRPLIAGQEYSLYVNISTERNGLGEDNISFPDKALDQIWIDQTALLLTVIASSHDFDVREPRVRPLNMPRQGPSEEVHFSVSPLRSEGRGFIQVEVFYRGYLLQSKQVEALIIPTAVADVPTSLRPFQTARTTFTTTTHLDPDVLPLLPERVLTVDVERDKRDGSVDFRFLDRSHGGQPVAYYDTRLQPEALGQALKGGRKLLEHMATGEHENYKWKLTGDDALLNAYLPPLADAGRSLYRALLPKSWGNLPEEDQGERLQAALQPGTVIQINPILGVVTIPWALLYERHIKYVPGKTRICDAFATHGLNDADCPFIDDPYVVCPHAFWGYRYAIEQLPCWASGEKPYGSALIREINNGLPLLLNFNVWEKFSLWREHLPKIETAGQVQILVAEKISQLEDIWQNRGSDLDIVYFYCHGGVDEVEQKPYLELSDGKIASNFLEASNLSWPHSPLIFLNGCATGDYGPQSYVSLIDDFRKAGASGVVGTECSISELFAEAFATALFRRLFRQELLGRALLEVRREFLHNNKNPLGLAYTMYAAHEITLARPVSHP